ncbi:hypothetical protein KIL84_005818, partial [Mauremys mutica]
ASGTGPLGKRFVTAFLENHFPYLSTPQTALQLLITGYSPSTTVTVTGESLGFQKVITLGSGQTVPVQLPASAEMVGGGLFNSAVVVEANKDISVLALNYKHQTADSTVVYPLESLGNEYYIVTPREILARVSNSPEFAVVAGPASTTVQIHLKGLVFFEDRYYNQSSPLSVTLRPYQAIQLQSRDGFSGTRVSAQHPVAVLSGHSCISLMYGQSHVVEQLLPVSSWGSTFVVPPLGAGYFNFDRVYITASQPTHVRHQRGEESGVQDMAAGDVMEVEMGGAKALSISASAHIQVLYYSPGGENYGTDYAPFIMNIPPVTSYCLSYRLGGLQEFDNYAAVIAKNSAVPTLTLDKQTLGRSQWHPVDTVPYLWSIRSLGKESSSHILEHPSSTFGVLSFGVSRLNSYGSVAVCAKDSPANPTPSCDTVQCRKKETCQMVNGSPACVAQSSATCWLSGDPHYKTFDGRYYDFMGTCTYTVAKTCGPNVTLPSFTVEAKNENRGNTRVSYAGFVTVRVYNVTISVVRRETGFVRVNAQRSHLPISLLEGKLKVYQRGVSVVIETDFSLRVSYDWNSYLVVQFSSSFWEHVCGLCGNYNGVARDDFATPTGALAASPVEFGKSWKVEDGDRFCWDDCHGECKSCSPELVSRYKAEPFCGWITKEAGGPFSQCHSMIDPKIYLDNCVYDLCMNDGLKEMLCQALASYADACRREGVDISDWRTLAGCPLPCPENSQYQLCGSACPSTCNNFASLDKCRLPCMETCQCKQGYMLDGGQCIPKGRCGCIHKGRLYAPGEHFWGDRKCRQKCQCNLHSRKVTCQLSRCQEGEECRVANGIRSCYPTRYGTCSALGESHYITFDGLHYDFRGTCVYLLAGLCHKNSSLVKFQVLVQYQRKGSQSGSGTKVVEIHVYGVKLVIIHGKVRLNGLQINLPYNIDYDKISAYHRGWDIVVKTAFGLTVTFDGQNHIRVKVPATYGRSVCGLCGNFDGEDDNDMTMSNLLPAPTPSDFGRSWKARDIPGCIEMEKEDCMDIARVEKQHRKSKKECGLLLIRDGPFKKCHNKVNPEGYFKDCIFDRCSHKDNQTVVCHILACYAAACQAAGAKVYEWRTNKFCRPPCPQNSHYEMCSSSCPATCRSLYVPTRCPSKCREGCVCNEGFVLSGDQCVPLSQCGCVHRGFYYKPGETFYPNGFCKQKCSCQAGGIVECHHFSCGPNEECRVVDGIQKCHPVVPRAGTCHAAGDPHYLTFDGFPFDFQGNCTYVLAKSCVRKGYLPSFAIHVKNERLGRSKAAVTNTVSIIVYRRTFTLVRNRNGIVLVNGISYYLPFQLESGLVRVYYHGANVVLRTKFGLHISFDLNYYLAITVPKSYRSQTCGLCGNYNGKPHDDLLRPNGHLARDLRDLGVSWRVRVPGAVCDHGCASLVCPACQESRKASYVHNNYCGIIRAPYGPFSTCYSTLNPTVFFNNCVHDLCKAGGNRRLMCRSIHSYVTACQAAGVKIKPWRTKKFCPMTCPANSHYKLCANPCSSGCKGVANITKCPKICAEGCQCNKGYFWAGNECVSIRHCHCFRKGRYYKPGERVLTPRCRQRCRCIPRGGVVCQSFQCPAGELCELSQGRWGCVRRDGNCTITRGDVFTSYDGVSGKVPLDGTYEISSLIDTRAASWFRVVVEFQTCKKCRAPRVTAVTVYFHKLTILVNRNGRVLVNGRPVRLPARPSRAVSVSRAGNVVTVAQGSALRVLFSTSGDVTVRIDGKLARKVQAACGNYNGNSADDLRLPDGTVLDNIGEVLSYWRFSENPQDDYD